jgi:hypothetical protein
MVLSEFQVFIIVLTTNGLSFKWIISVFAFKLLINRIKLMSQKILLVCKQLLRHIVE